MCVIFRGTHYHFVSYTNQQLRAYNQLKAEVLLYEKERKRKGWLYALGFCLLVAFVLKGLGLLWALYQKEEWQLWLEQQDWVEILLHVFFGSLLLYIVMVQRIYHRLINKKREQHNLLLEHPDLEKATS